MLIEDMQICASRMFFPRHKLPLAADMKLLVSSFLAFYLDGETTYSYCRRVISNKSRLLFVSIGASFLDFYSALKLLVIFVVYTRAHIIRPTRKNHKWVPTKGKLK